MSTNEKICYYISILDGRKSAVVRHIIGVGSGKKYNESSNVLDDCFNYLVNEGYIELIVNPNEMNPVQKAEWLNGDYIYRLTDKKYEEI